MWDKLFNSSVSSAYVKGHIGRNPEVDPDPEVETKRDLKDPDLKNVVEGQGHGIEDLAPGIENAQDPRTEKTGKIEKDHAQGTEKDHGPGIGIDVGKTKGLGQEIEGIFISDI